MARYEITTPEPRWTGEVAGVAFAHGRAEVDSDATPARVLAYFRRKGYGVVQLDAPPTAEPEAEAAADAEKKTTSRRGGTNTKETP